jgi:hypothetical protein
MRKRTRFLVVLIVLPWALWGCGGSGNLIEKIPPTINTVKASNRYVKQVAAILVHTPSTAVGQEAGSFYFKTLIHEIADEDSRSRLVTPEDKEFPGFMDALTPAAHETMPNPDMTTLCKGARQAGYQGVVVAAIRDIRVSTIRSGILWFRKQRYLVHFSVTADLYDPYVAAKVVSGVLESKVRISKNQYESYQSGTASSIEELDDEMVDAAEGLGERIGEALSDMKWKISVRGTEGDRLVIPAGSNAGLKEGDRFLVFDGRRQLAGQQGERFIVPGYEVGTFQVDALTEQKAEGRTSTEGKIQYGDIAVPVR